MCSSSKQTSRLQSTTPQRHKSDQSAAERIVTMAENSIDFHPIAIPSPNPSGPGPAQTPMSPPGSAIFSQSESDVDEGPASRFGSQEDASILYGRPQRRHKTRTLSAVSIFAGPSVRPYRPSCVALTIFRGTDRRLADYPAPAQHLWTGPERNAEPSHVAWYVPVKHRRGRSGSWQS